MVMPDAAVANTDDCQDGLNAIINCRNDAFYWAVRLLERALDNAGILPGESGDISLVFTEHEHMPDVLIWNSVTFAGIRVATSPSMGNGKDALSAWSGVTLTFGTKSDNSDLLASTTVKLYETHHLCDYDSTDIKFWEEINSVLYYIDERIPNVQNVRRITPAFIKHVPTTINE